MMNNINTSLGEDIRRRRKERKMTQAQLAKAVGVSELSIRKYEKNERSPKFDVLQRLDEVLDLNLDIMQFNSSPPHSTTAEDDDEDVDYGIDYEQYEPDPASDERLQEVVAGVHQRKKDAELIEKGIQPNPHRKYYSELPSLRDILTDKRFKTISEEEAQNIIEQIDQFYKTGPTMDDINQEEALLTHEVFDTIMQPYQDQGIFDIIEVLSYYLMLNVQGKDLVLNILKAIYNSQNLIQKKYDPYDPRPAEGRYSRY